MVTKTRRPGQINTDAGLKKNRQNKPDGNGCQRGQHIENQSFGA